MKQRSQAIAGLFLFLVVVFLVGYVMHQEEITHPTERGSILALDTEQARRAWREARAGIVHRVSSLQSGFLFFPEVPPPDYIRLMPSGDYVFRFRVEHVTGTVLPASMFDVRVSSTPRGLIVASIHAVRPAKAKGGKE